MTRNKNNAVAMLPEDDGSDVIAVDMIQEASHAIALTVLEQRCRADPTKRGSWEMPCGSRKLGEAILHATLMHSIRY